MAVKHAVRTLLRSARLLALGAPLSCGTHYADVIEAADTLDPCMQHAALDCALDVANGCSLQPNPTGCTRQDPNCGAGLCLGGYPFVRRSGETLFLHDTPFTFVGTVSWWAAWQDGGCQIYSYANQQTALDASFDQLAEMQLTVLRFWAFQSYAGVGGTDYSHFDRVVAGARAAGIRLMFVLENMHPSDCSSGTRDDNWLLNGYKSPYGSYALSYRDYVAALVQHYRDEPTIMGWELMHEASATQFAVLDAFTDDISTVIRKSDSNHLIALGVTDSSPATSTDGDASNFYKLHDRAAIDLIDVHDFDTPAEALPLHVQRTRAIAHALDKPIFLGATGVTLKDSSFAARAAQLENKLETAQANGFSGFLVYDFVPNWSVAYYDFDARAAEPLAGPNGVLAQHASKF